MILSPLVFPFSSLRRAAEEPNRGQGKGGGAPREHLGMPKMVQKVAKVESPNIARIFQTRVLIATLTVTFTVNTMVKHVSKVSFQ